MYVVGGESLNEYYASVIEDELNVKEIEYTNNLDSFIKHNLKLNFRVAGAKLSKNVGLVKNMLQELDQEAAFKELSETNKLKVGEFTLDSEDIIVETVEADTFASESNGKITVVLDTELTKELIDEGYVREVVSKIQQERKEAGFEVVDHITLFFKGSTELLSIIKQYENRIKSQTLADNVKYNELDGFSKEWEIQPYVLNIGVKKE